MAQPAMLPIKKDPLTPPCIAGRVIAFSIGVASNIPVVIGPFA